MKLLVNFVFRRTHFWDATLRPSRDFGRRDRRSARSPSPRRYAPAAADLSLSCRGRLRPSATFAAASHRSLSTDERPQGRRLIPPAGRPMGRAAAHLEKTRGRCRDVSIAHGRSSSASRIRSTTGAWISSAGQIAATDLRNSGGTLKMAANGRPFSSIPMRPTFHQMTH